MTTRNTDVVEHAFAAYLRQDRPAMEKLLADDLVFTSPQDAGIDRAVYFERCWPTADRLASQVVLHVEQAGHDQVLVVYEYELRSGGTYRNAELHTVRDHQISEIQVFFGGEVHRPV